MSLTHKQTADRLRIAMAYIRDISGNENYYDSVHGTNANIAETLRHLNEDFPVFSRMEQKFIDIVTDATGYDLTDITQFLRTFHATGEAGKYMALPHGNVLRDHWATFQAAYDLGRKDGYDIGIQDGGTT